MEKVLFPVQVVPSTLTQPILPNWSFNLFNVDLGWSGNAAKEYRLIHSVGSYGRQIGHIGEALEVLIRQSKILESKELDQKARDVLEIFLGDVAIARRK